MRIAFLADEIECAPTGARNMAVDHALLEQSQRDAAVTLRLYSWQPACLSFGRHQPARGLFSRDAARRAGIDVVRRPTGGLAVLHDRELTYSFCAPAPLLGGPRGTYTAVNRALVCALRRLGVPAVLSEGARRSRFGTVQPCFAEPAAGEVVAAGRKLVGSAQRCERRCILQHGSVLLEDTQEDIARLALLPMDMGGRATSVAAVLGGRPSTPAIVAAIAAGFEETLGIGLAPARLAANVELRAGELEPTYASVEWTWRR